MSRKLTRKDFLKNSLALAAYPLWKHAVNLLPETKYPDPAIDKRVKALIDKMTLAEKVSQLRYDAPAIKRLGIPEYNWWNECIHGVARAGLATVFPQTIGLSASWNVPLLKEVANAISDEARAKHQEFLRIGRRDIYMGLTFWAPNINLVRDPRWGRGQETYGEDPFLTSRMAVSFIEGLQGDDPHYLKLVATAKHFAMYSGPEPMRHKMNVEVNNRDLHETYLPAFKASVQEAHVASIMCSYNSFRGYPCCGNDVLLNGILRNDWSFDGYVVSDCWAIANFYQKGGHDASKNAAQAAALAMNSGTDLNCGVTYRHLPQSVKQHLVDEKKIDQALYRLFKARFRLGMFDNPDKVPYTHIPYNVVDSRKHRELALQMARESIVLLKNEPAAGGSNPLLPLSKDLKSIAVIGPNADDYDVMLGNYHGTPGILTTPLEAIRKKVSARTRVRYAQGCNLVKGYTHLDMLPSEYLSPANGQGHGLRAEYYNDMGLKGSPSISRVDKKLWFIWKDHTPVTGRLADAFSVRWTGVLKAPRTGMYIIGLDAKNKAKLFFDGQRKLDFDAQFDPDRHTFRVQMNKGERHDIRIEYASNGPDPQIRLLWDEPGRDLMREAVQTASESDAVILCLGLNSHLEGEEMPVELDGFKGGDRTKLKLPDEQMDLIKRIQATGKPVVLVIMSGSAVSFEWARGHVPSIVQAWYGGQAGGPALADVLFGDYNPGGRLPLTIYSSVKDLPPFEDYSMKNRTYRYFTGTPFYPFGYGLSYTRFAYENLEMPDKITLNEPLEFHINVRNQGSRDGDEVTQVYVSHPGTSGPIRSLKAYKRTHLRKGESRTIHFKLSPEDLSIFDSDGKLRQSKGKISISVGGKQPGFTGPADAHTTEAVTREVEVV